MTSVHVGRGLDRDPGLPGGDRISHPQNTTLTIPEPEVCPNTISQAQVGGMAAERIHYQRQLQRTTAGGCVGADAAPEEREPKRKR